MTAKLNAINTNIIGLGVAIIVAVIGYFMGEPRDTAIFLSIAGWLLFMNSVIIIKLNEMEG